MTVPLPSSRFGLVRLSSAIISAYVIRNAVPAAQIGDLIAMVHAGLNTLGRPAAVGEEAPAKPSPAEIRRSVTPDVLVSFVDGRSYKTLKRHLGRHGLTPAAYRERFGLPKDYPMVASGYAAERSALAKANGLGTARQPQAPTPAAVAPVAVDAVPKRGGRPKAKPAATGPA